MTCYHPITAYQSNKQKNQNGKSIIIFDKKLVTPDFKEITLPCQNCIGCRIERSRQWAMRCVHESSLYKNNCFITLTYNSDHLPKNNSLNVEDFQLFMKRLRKRFSGAESVVRDGVTSRPIRFFHCAEYGKGNAVSGVFGIMPTPGGITPPPYGGRRPPASSRLYIQFYI